MNYNFSGQFLYKIMHEVKFFKAKPSPDRHGKTGRAERGGLAVRAG